MRSRPGRFIVASILLAAALIPGAFLRGEVLTQSSLLFQYSPWREHAPADAAPANPLLSDPAIVFYPLLTHTVETVRRWQVPLWNSSLYAGGHPFLASFQTAVLSPFTAIAYVVPLPWATVPMALAPLIVGATGMFVFMRGLGLGAAAAWFAGMAFLANGFAVAWLEHPLTGVACWLPWVLRASDGLVHHGRRSGVAGLAMLVALVILCGHPETAAKVLLLASAYTATALCLDGSRHWRMAVVAYATGVLLTAVQVVPFIEYLVHSQALRSRQALTTNPSFMAAATLITGLVPDFWGNPAHGTYVAQVNRVGVPSNHAEQALYAGIAVVLLAPAALVVRPRHWRVWFFALAGGLALALMFGMPGVLDVASVVPLLRVTMLSRFGLIAIVSAIVLAAYAVHALTTEPHAHARRVARVVLVTAVAVIGIIGVGWLIAPAPIGMNWEAGGRAGAIVIAALLVLATAALVALRARGALTPAAFALATCAVLAADLIVVHRGVHPTMPAGQVYPLTPELARIRRDPGLFRVYGWGHHLVPNTAMAYGLADVRGWDGMNPYRFTRLLDLGYLRQSGHPQQHLANPSLLDLLNVKYVFVPADVSLPASRYVRVPDTGETLYVNTRALPRAFLVNRYRVLDDAALERTLHDGTTDLARVALLEQELPPGERPQATTDVAAGTVEVHHYRDTFVELRVTAAARSLLVISDAHYPGWVATVDGKSVPIRRADFALRAVAVDTGTHIVRFAYRPVSVAIGAVVSALAAVAVLASLHPFRKPHPSE
jgi:hypothetical protein